MRLDLPDTLAIMERLLEKEPQTSKPGGFTVRLRRLRELLVETQTAEPTLAAIAGFVFPGVSRNSLRTTLLEFRKSLTKAGDAVGLEITLIRPDARGVDADQVVCHFEGKPIPMVFDTSGEDAVLSRENEVIEPRARATKIFISFAVADQKWSREFTDQLKANLPLRFAEPVQLWRFDEKGGILPGEDNEQIIRKRMNESQFGILLVTPTYLERPFIKRVELPHFLGENAKAHPIPVALADFVPGQDKHEWLDAKNVFTHQGKSFYQTDAKDRGAFIKALCDRIAETITKYPAPPASHTSTEIQHVGEAFAHLCPELREEDGSYVPNHGRMERSLGKSATKADEDWNEASVPVLETLQSWIDDPADSAYMAILGESGAGKTMTCSKLAHTLNARKSRSCIYIDLRLLNESGLLKTQPNPTLHQILDAILSRNTQHGKISPERVLQAVREQGALLIWDGLDEVLVHLSTDEGDAMFRQLKEALPPPAIARPGKTPGRLIIACRTHWFRSYEHEASALTHAQRGPIHADAPETQRARFRVLRLLPFDDDQIRAYLGANVPGLDLERALDVIHRVHNLHDLAQRPYCLSLMRTSLPDLDRTLAAGKKVRSVDLYRSLVRSWLARDNTKHRFDEDDKPRLMASLAAWMWREGAKTLTSERLGQWLKETIIADPTFRAMYGDSFKETKKRDELLQDFRTATFIARWDGDCFRFAHTSLQEYFLATALVAALEKGDVNEWLLPRVNQETLDFAAELFLQQAEESRAARTRFEQTLARLLGETVPNCRENALAFYLRLHATGESIWTPTKFDLRNLDLTAWKFTGTAQNPLRLPQVDFSGGLLIRAQFHYVKMTGSRWQGANLCGAEFLECGLDDADFTSKEGNITCLEGVRLHTCQLSGSRISGAVLDGLQAESPMWNDPTEEHWRAVLAEYRPESRTSFLEKWTPPLPTGSTSPLVAVEGLRSTPSAQWSSGHREAVTSVAYFPDGRRVVSGSLDHSVRIWDANSGACLYTLEGHSDRVHQVVVSSDGRLICSASADGSLRVWNAATGICLKKIEGHQSWVMTCAFFPDSKHIISGSADGTVRIWKTENGECLEVLSSYSQGAIFFGNKLAISSDGSQFASTIGSKSIIVWGEDIGEQMLEGHSEQIDCLAFSPDGHHLASGSHDDTVRLWDVKEGVCRLILEGHSQRVRTISFSPDGHKILTGSADNNLRVWDAQTGRCLHVIQDLSDSVISAAYSQDGRRIVVGSGMSVQIWDFEKRICLHKIIGIHKWISSIAFSHDGNRLLVGSYDDTVWMWDVETGIPSFRLTGHGKSLSCLAFSPDGNRFVTGSGTGIVRICDAKSGADLLTIACHSTFVRSLIFSPDGRFFVSGSNDKTIKIWETDSGSCIRTFEGHKEPISCLTLSKRAEILASGAGGNNDNTVRIWDVRTGVCLQTLKGHSNQVSSLAFSPDGLRLASGSLDNPIRVWDVRTGNCLFTIENCYRQVTNLVFSEDGCRILGFSLVHGSRAWDAKCGRPLEICDEDRRFLRNGSVQTGLGVSLSPFGTIRANRTDGTELDLSQERNGDYAVMERAPGETCWRLARAKGEYWRYVNYATDGPEGRVLWSADVLGPVPEV